MGLDQYAYSRKPEREGEELDRNVDVLLMQWRKHSNLEGWMADLYNKRGGKGDFNCVELKLTTEDLVRLESEFRNLKQASGFFWGQSHPDDDRDTEDFISLAYEAIDNGNDVIYTSWW